jgi:hypothetical protein
MTSQRPVRLFEPDKDNKIKTRWGMHFRDAWREVEAFPDPYTGTRTVRMNGNLIANPVAWASS